jgi:hypothetical protein
MCLRFMGDHGSDSFVGKNFQQQTMRDSPIDDMRPSDTALNRIQATQDLGNHAATDNAPGNQIVDFLFV